MNTKWIPVIAPISSLVLFLGIAMAQQPTFTSAQFDQQILVYVPQQRPGVSDPAFKQGVFYLDETKSATKGDPANLNVADYWNITMAFLTLKEPKVHVELSFNKAVEADPSSLCAYLNSLGHQAIAAAIPEVFLPFYAETCIQFTPERVKIDLEAYCTKHRVDPALVVLMQEIEGRDKRYRGQGADLPWDKQTPLDQVNQHLIDSLFNQYSTYLGKSHVGPEYQHTMWAVIQHSPLSMQERYVPVVHQAWLAEEISSNVPLKLLIDRIHWLTEGTQIFGSQGQVPLAAATIREQVKAKYGLE